MSAAHATARSALDERSVAATIRRTGSIRATVRRISLAGPHCGPRTRALSQRSLREMIARKEGAMNQDKSENIAARVGRWSARHWKSAVFGWLAFVVVAYAL